MCYLQKNVYILWSVIACMDMWYFSRICAHARTWREFAKCRFAHFPSFFSVHVETYAPMPAIICGCLPCRSVDSRHKFTSQWLIIYNYGAWWLSGLERRTLGREIRVQIPLMLLLNWARFVYSTLPKSLWVRLVYLKNMTENRLYNVNIIKYLCKYGWTE